MKNTVVYYPFVYPSISWVRTASLCWDRVFTLAPAVAPPVPSDISEFQNTVGNLLNTLDVAEIGGKAIVYDAFVRWLDDWRGDLADEFPEALPRGDERLSAMYVGKFDAWSVFKSLAARCPIYIEQADHQSLRRVTEEQALDHYTKVFDPYSTGPLAFIPSEVGTHYLALCGGHAATERGADLFAAETDYAHSVQLFDPGGHAAFGQHLLTALFPDRLDTLGATQVRDLRLHFSEQRRAFQAEVTRLAERWQYISSEDELDRAKSEALEVAETRIGQVERAYRDARAVAVAKTIAVSVAPSGAATLLASALSIGIFQPASVMGALAFAGAQFLHESRRAWGEAAKSPWSYVLEIEKRLPPKRKVRKGKKTS